MNTRQRIVRLLLTLVGLFLCFVSILHDVVNIRLLRRVMARGEITVRMGPQFVANVTFAGAALTVIGVILLVAAHDLRTPHRASWLISVLIGVFLVATGVAGYLLEPMMFVPLSSCLGALISIPLLVWRKHITKS